MSDQKILKGSHSVTSSPESVDGREHYSSQDGVQNDLFGLEARPASHFPQPGKEKEKTTSDISGPSSLISSASANLQQSLENKLRQLSDLNGSTIYKLTLKKKDTPQGRSYYHLAASVPRTKEKDSSSWPTPKAKEVTEDYDQYIKRMKRSKHEKNRGKTEPASVSMAAQLTSWLTPTTSDMNGVREMDGKRSGGLNTQAQSAWPTPRVADTNNLNNSEKVVQSRVEKGRATVAEMVTHNTNAWLNSGEAQKSSTAETESTVPSQLNPRFSLWLMGYPIEWAYCAERVTPSSRKRQRKS